MPGNSGSMERTDGEIGAIRNYPELQIACRSHEEEGEREGVPLCRALHWANIRGLTRMASI